MQKEPVTPDQEQDIKELADIIGSVPKELRTVLTIAMASFMTGMDVGRVLPTSPADESA